MHEICGFKYSIIKCDVLASCSLNLKEHFKISVIYTISIIKL